MLEQENRGPEETSGADSGDTGDFGGFDAGGFGDF